MSNVKLTNENLRVETGKRLRNLFEVNLGLSLSEASRRLEYKNPSTLYAARDGETIPHPEKLLKMVDLFREITGEELDLHWLLTGKGDALYGNRLPEMFASDYDIIMKIVKLDPIRKSALKRLLGPDEEMTETIWLSTPKKLDGPSTEHE